MTNLVAQIGGSFLDHFSIDESNQQQVQKMMQLKDD